VEVAIALGGSFKLVTLAPRTVREMTQLPKETHKDDGGGGDNCSYKIMCKALVKSSLSANQHPVFYRPDALPVAQ